MIESSLAKQYGIRVRQNLDMSWPEFCTLVSGLMHDTPLGQIVAIRSEDDPKVIKEFSKDQKRIHRAWKEKQAHANIDNFDDLEKMLNNMFGKGAK